MLVRGTRSMWAKETDGRVWGASGCTKHYEPTQGRGAGIDDNVRPYVDYPAPVWILSFYVRSKERGKSGGWVGVPRVNGERTQSW